MNELFKILGTVAVDNSGANAALDDTTDRAEKSHGKISEAFGKVGSAALNVGKVVGAGLGVAATAIGALTKQALDGYSEYEQLAGGVETLFKDSANTVKAYADNAYKTAGLSANDYMSTVTSFSASLLQGLNGDTAKAAEIANRAITDMSDNANKMGTDMSMIRNAYQGFAKQNYTMLDNLKLGYGGTQAEMARLINDSGVLGEAMKVDAESVKNVSFDKIIEAIGVVQDRLGITGTTASEAASTIEGSAKSIGAAWKNLLAGLGKEDADLSGLIDQFVEGLLIATDNMMPRIKKILGGMSQAIGKLMPIISEQIPSMLRDLLPGLIEGAVSLLNGLVSALPTLLQILIEQVPFIVSEIGNALVQAVPHLFKSLKEIVGKIFDFISIEVLHTGVSFDDLLGGLFNSDGFAILSGVFDDVKTSLGGVVEGFRRLGSTILGGIDASAIFQKTFKALANAMKWCWNNLGKPVYDAIAVALNWLADNWGTISATMEEVFTALWEACETVWEEIGLPIWEIIETTVEWVIKAFKRSLPTIQTIFSSVMSGVQWTWKNVLQPVYNAIASGIQWVADNWGTILDEMGSVFGVLWEGCVFVWNLIGQPICDAIVSAVEWVAENWDSITTTISDVFKGLWEACKGYWDLFGQPVMDRIGIVIDWVKGLFEEHMPAIQEFFGDMVDGIKDTWENHLKPAFDAVAGFITDVLMPPFVAIVSFVNDVLTAAFKYALETVIQPIVENVFGVIVDLWENTLKPCFDGILDFITGVFTGDFESAFDGLKQYFEGVFNGFQTVLEAPFNLAKDTIGSVIESIKGFFDFSGFEFKIPSIPMPHFSITPKGWGFGDLLKGKIPKLGIEWYAKGGVLTDPTIFGMNGNKAMVGGEAGPEAVAPIDVLQKYVSDAVASQNAGMVDALNKILDAILAMDENMGGNLRDALDGTALKIGEREFAKMVNKSVSRTQANELRVGGAYV